MPSELRPAQVDALRWLRGQKGPITGSHLNSANVARPVMHALKRRGLVKQHGNEWTLTEQGRAALSV